MLTEYCMTNAQIAKLREDCESIDGELHIDQQDRVNDSWKALSEVLHFQWVTVRPSPSGPNFFFAKPSTN